MIAENVWESRRKRAWPSDRWGALTCRAIWDETADVRTFLLTPTEGSRIAHNPGQYMTFRIETPGGTVERCYTIASSAARNGGIEITVKRHGGGAASGVLHDTLQVGTEIAAFGPSGQFTPIPFEGTKIALIAAGSGVTPMLSVLRTAADRAHVDRDAARSGGCGLVERNVRAHSGDQRGGGRGDEGGGDQDAFHIGNSMGDGCANVSKPCRFR